MALKDMVALIDEKLADVFHSAKPDPVQLRAPVLKAIERTRSQFLQTEPVRGPKWFKASNSVAAFTPTLRGGYTLPINGKPTVYVPSERFLSFLDHMKDAVDAGEFDSELANPGDDAPATAKVSVPKTREPRDPSAPKRQWTPERRARFAATVAERKARKSA